MSESIPLRVQQGEQEYVERTVFRDADEHGEDEQSEVDPACLARSTCVSASLSAAHQRSRRAAASTFSRSTAQTHSRTSRDNATRTMDTSTRRITAPLNRMIAPSGLKFDNQFWSNHPDWIVSQSEGTYVDVYIHQISASRAIRVTDSGDCNRADLYVFEAR